MAKKYHATLKQFAILCTNGMVYRVVSSNYLKAKLELKNQGFKPIQLTNSTCYF